MIVQTINFLTLSLSFHSDFVDCKDSEAKCLETPRVIQHTSIRKFPAPNVFVEENGAGNQWLPNRGKTGLEAFFIIDLGCVKNISGLILKNTHDYKHNNRGTQNFTIYISSSNYFWGHWTKKFTGSLKDVRNVELKDPSEEKFKVEGR